MNSKSIRKPGRPPSADTLAQRESQKLLTETRPNYASTNPSYPEWVKYLISPEPLKVVRQRLGLNHRTIPNSVVYDALAVVEGANKSFALKTKATIKQCKENIARSTKKGGQHVPDVSLKTSIVQCPEAIDVIAKFEERRLTYKQFAKALNELRLPTPSERTLRRWVKMKNGHKLTPK